MMINYLKTLFFVVALGVAFSLLAEKTTESTVQVEQAVAMVPSGIPITERTPPCIKMYYFIEKYADKYDIPLKYAYGVANAETGYRGPFHWGYNHEQTSHAGAVGPMQIMPSTADMMWPDSSISVKRLRTDVEFNVHTSMKLLRHLHNRYGDWQIVFGCYNTGKPLVNDYAIKVYNFKTQFK
jgi:hypothetical protein